MSYARTKVTRYLVPVSSYGSQYLTEFGNTINPIGNPVFAVFSYPWAGLDPNTGDPQGFVGGKPSTDYASISQSPLDSLNYNGPAQPVYFGRSATVFNGRIFHCLLTSVIKVAIISGDLPLITTVCSQAGMDIAIMIFAGKKPVTKK